MRICVLSSLLLVGLCELGESQTAQPSYSVSTVAGQVPRNTGLALTQYLDSPAAVVYDAQGTLYFATLYRIWRLNSDGTITHVAGTGSIASARGNGDGGTCNPGHVRLH